MVKLLIILLFYVYLLIPALSGSNQSVKVTFLPWLDPVIIPVGHSFLLFAGLGTVITILVALIDRADLEIKNRKLSKQLRALEEEAGELRQKVAEPRRSNCSSFEGCRCSEISALRICALSGVTGPIRTLVQSLAERKVFE